MLLIRIFVLHLLRFVQSNFILPEFEDCDRPLGMESGSIKDEDITASSTHDFSSVGPRMSRIRNEIEGGAWCPSKPIGPKSFEYLQIDLHDLFFITAIETQGRFDNGQGNEYAEFYQIQYQRDLSSSQWFTYSNKITNKTILKGNLNTYLAEKRSLHRSITAKRIRIIPYSSRWRTVCLRVELYGCPMKTGLISYRTSPPIEVDFTSDGQIGKLSDGILGIDDEKSLIWKTSPIFLQFHFDSIRQFESIRIYSSKSKFRSIEIRFDDTTSIRHDGSKTIEFSSKIFLNEIIFNQTDSTMFNGEDLQMKIDFDAESFSLTEISFENHRITSRRTSSIDSTSMSSTICPNSTMFIDSSSTIIALPWLILIVISLIIFCSIPFLIGYFIRIYCQQKHSSESDDDHHHYSKCSRLKPMRIRSNETSLVRSPPLPPREKHFPMKKSNLDDMISMGSYIYPITSTTSLLNPSSPSSIFKSEQYAIIDHPTTNSTCHYASSDIGLFHSEKSSSLFNCSLVEEILPLKCSSPLPPCLDPTKLNRIFLISQSNCGEIFIGNLIDDNQHVLIKMIKPKFIESSRQKFFSELNLLSRLKNENIVSICSIHIDRLILVQEHSPCGTLRDYFRSSTPNEFSSRLNFHFSCQLSNALEYLSNLHLVHNDVAARNCLFFPDFSIKLTDCAMALIDNDNEYWICLNGDKLPLRWMAPERLTKSSTIHSDIYSFGVTLWEFWSRCSSLPFGNLTNEEIYQTLILHQMNNEEISMKLFSFSSSFEYPKEIFDLLCQCCQIDGNHRPSIVDLHQYFQRQFHLC